VRVRGPKFEVFGTSNPEFRTSDRTFLACLAFPAPRSVAPEDFFSMLLGFNALRGRKEDMADSAIRGQRTRAAVQKNATSVSKAKKSKAASAAVLILSGSTALRRRKSAETLAETLKVDLFRVDLSAVLSQYIGETEKNLNDVFDKAEASGAILFFDEIDALFGIGSKVNDANDRSANPEKAHYLQRIESQNGIFFLTTNGKRHIEQAFYPWTQVVVMVGTTGTGQMRKK
jgi:sulfite reductase alpha subunit-like flavoprotein